MAVFMLALSVFGRDQTDYELAGTFLGATVLLIVSALVFPPYWSYDRTCLARSLSGSRHHVKQFVDELPANGTSDRSRMDEHMCPNCGLNQ